MEHEHQYKLILDQEIENGAGMPEGTLKQIGRAILAQTPKAKCFQWAQCESCGLFTYLPCDDGEIRIAAGMFFYKGKQIDL